MATVVSDIASASTEQAAGIEQVNKALTQMDEVTQQNSALVEENAATAKTLEHQSKAMHDEVSVFRVNEGDSQRRLDTARRIGQCDSHANEDKSGAAKPLRVKPAASATEVKPASAKPPAAAPSERRAGRPHAGRACDCRGRSAVAGILRPT